MSRTTTGSQQVFDLQHPHPVTFDFSNPSTDGLLITIPSTSAWASESHWHYTTQACEDIWLVSGHTYCLFRFIMNWGNGSGDNRGPGPILPLVPEMSVFWRRSISDDARDADQAAVVSYRFSSSPENFALYRQICSVNQDAEVYFRLTTTPSWLRFAYAFWKRVPFLGKMVTGWLVAWCLWVQLRVIYAKE